MARKYKKAKIVQKIKKKKALHNMIKKVKTTKKKKATMHKLIKKI